MSRRSSQTRTDNRLDTSSMTNKNQPKNLYRHIIYKDAVFFPTHGDRLIESPIFSSLTLQKLMYFNIYYNFLFFYLMIVTFLYKLWVMKSDAFHIVRPILLIVWAAVEAFRFHNGYVGNLKETFPDLFFFNLLSFGSIGIVIAMMVPGKTFPIEIACEVIFVIFGVLEVIIGYYTMMKLSVSQEALFYLRSANSQIRMKREDRGSYEKRAGDGETSRLLKDNSGGEIELARGQRSPRSAEQLPENRGPENRGARRVLGRGNRTGYNQLAQED